MTLYSSEGTTSNWIPFSFVVSWLLILCAACSGLFIDTLWGSRVINGLIGLAQVSIRYLIWLGVLLCMDFRAGLDELTGLSRGGLSLLYLVGLMIGITVWCLSVLYDPNYLSDLYLFNRMFFFVGVFVVTDVVGSYLDAMYYDPEDYVGVRLTKDRLEDDE